MGESIASKTIQPEIELNKTETINLSLNSILKDVEPGLFVAVFDS